MTEVVSGDIKEGDQIIVGTAQASSASPAAARGPRMPF
jgi:hypothetical protein